MVDMTDRTEVPRNRLLYDKEFLGNVVDDVGNAIEIKHEVKTSAHIYEIRTATEYWFGGQNDHRTSDAIWMACKAVDDGMWALNDDNELVYGDEVMDA